MASQFKIPKKKQSADGDSAHLHMQSPLSRLQSSASDFKGYGDQSGRGGADRMHAGSSPGSTNRQSTPCKPFFKDVVKTLLGLNSPSGGGASAANHRAAAGGGGASNRQSQPGQKGEASGGFSNGWRPKRASDRLLQPDVTSGRLSPPQKKKSESSASSLASRRISVASADYLAELRGDERAGSLRSSAPAERTWRRADGKSDGRNSPDSPLKQRKNSSVSDSEDDLVSPQRTRNKPPPSSSSSSSATAGLSSRATPDRRRSLERTAWLAASSNLRSDPREKERERWREFTERKTTNRSAAVHLRLRRAKQTPSEPIVLSSEEEEEGEDDADGGKTTSESRPDESPNCDPVQAQRVRPAVEDVEEADDEEPPLTPPTPSFLELEFVSLHAGLMHADANGKIKITENEITLPLKGAEDGEVAVVASELRGYGVWDGGVVQGAPLLDEWEGPAPTLLFLWVSDDQANLLRRELTAIQTAGAASGPSCSFLLLVLKEQLQELQAALLASILDMKEYRRGRSSSGGLTSPLDWTQGLLLIHTAPPPLDQHLLRLLGQSKETSGQVSSSHRNKKSDVDSSGLQQLPARLIQYPAAPCKGRITVTKEDLACLSDGEFLNDVIIDFYLKYLLLEGVGGSVAERSHVFSSFFYKQLSRRRAAGEDDAPSVPDRHMRHQRVKTWTRHVDIFTKDFLFVPVNQEAHWYLVVVCFPGLEEVRYEERQSRTGDSERSAGNRVVSLRSQQLPECTEQGWQRDTALKRPCILVMDSLKLSYHENVCRLLRDYLQVEWEVRRGTPRLFTPDSMKSFNCRVPQQDNSSDCGLYLLQYVESFLQNPVVHFDLPTRLDTWFPRQRVRQKREEIRSLIMRMHESQQQNDRRTKTNKNKQ